MLSSLSLAVPLHITAIKVIRNHDILDSMQCVSLLFSLFRCCTLHFRYQNTVTCVFRRRRSFIPERTTERLLLCSFLIDLSILW